VRLTTAISLNSQRDGPVGRSRSASAKEIRSKSAQLIFEVRRGRVRCLKVRARNLSIVGAPAFESVTVDVSQLYMRRTWTAMRSSYSVERMDGKRFDRIRKQLGLGKVRISQGARDIASECLRRICDGPTRLVALAILGLCYEDRMGDC